MNPVIHLAPRRGGVALGAATMLLAGCVTLPLPWEHGATAPDAWQAPLPHDGRRADLTSWWEQFNDPLLARLIAAAEDASPTLASARTRIAQARANGVAAGAAMTPQLTGTASVSRARQDFVTPIGTTSTAGVQASWELDLFGSLRAGRNAATARLEGAEAGWHQARVSVAAEVATSYVGLRACEAQLVQTKSDSTSREETARLLQLSARAGFESRGNLALARASAAQSRAQLTSQRAQCELSVKALTALTAIAEPALRQQLAGRTGVLPQPQKIDVPAVPGDVLNQRPDLYIAARDVMGASADVSQARANRFPRITLGGQITAARFDSAPQFSSDGRLWSVGPLSVSLPVFDAGLRAANEDAARTRYEETAISYRATLRGAVREVEEALVQLQSAGSQQADSQLSADSFDDAYKAVQARFNGGLASLFELEDARRSANQAHSQLIEIERQRVAAWIALYRAIGGGWTAPSTRTAAGGQSVPK